MASMKPNNRVSFPVFHSPLPKSAVDSSMDGYYSDAYLSACSTFPSEDDISDATSLTVSDPAQTAHEHPAHEFIPNGTKRFKRYKFTPASWSQEKLWSMICLLISLFCILLVAVDITLKWMFYAHFSQFILFSSFASALKVFYIIFAVCATLTSLADILFLLKNFDGTTLSPQKVKNKLKQIYTVLLLNELPLVLCTILLAIYGFSCRLQQTFLSDIISKIYCVFGLVVILCRSSHFCRKTAWIPINATNLRNHQLATFAACLLCGIVICLKILLIIFAFSPYSHWKPSVNEPFSFQFKYGTHHSYFVDELESCEQQTDADLAFCPSRKDRHLFLGHNETFRFKKFNGQQFESTIPCIVWEKDIGGNLKSFIPYINDASLGEKCWIKFGMVYDRGLHIVKYNMLIMVQMDSGFKICSDIIGLPVNVPWTSSTVQSVVHHACAENDYDKLPHPENVESLLSEMTDFHTPQVRCSDWCLHTPNCDRCTLNSLTYSNRPAADGIYYFASKDECTCPNDSSCTLRQCQWTMNTVEGCYDNSSSFCPMPTPRQFNCMLETDVSVYMANEFANNKLGPMTINCNGCGGLKAIRDPTLHVSCL